MTFYQQQVQILQKELYSKGYLLNQVIRAKKFIDNNFSKGINLNDIAGEAFLSKFHFIRLFKTYYGVTPYQHLMRVRVAEAKKMLQSGMVVSAVCYEVGFESIPSFTKLFRAITGTTPFAYQNKKSNIE